MASAFSTGLSLTVDETEKKKTAVKKSRYVEQINKGDLELVKDFT